MLPRPYQYEEAALILKEMIEVLCADMIRKGLTSPVFTWWVSYDYKSLEACPDYNGPLSVDFYGRLHPKHSGGTVKMKAPTRSVKTVTEQLLASFAQKTDHRLLFRRLGVCAANVTGGLAFYQPDFFTDYDALEKESRIQRAMIEVRRKYGPNAIFRGMDLLSGATTLQRNLQIGGHRA